MLGYKLWKDVSLPRRALWLFGAPLQIILAMTASAQTPVQEPVAQSAPALEEIIVTAQRRQQTLQEAPVAVTFISPEATKNLDIRDLETVQFISPSMNFSSQVGYAQVFIRGIGSNYSNPGLETPVAIYQDDVYQTASNTSILKALDVGSIQVLNGPQGTLYGRNASGGVISLDTANPTKDEEADLSAEFGRFGHEQVDVVLNTPFTDDLSFRLAARYSHDDGYIHNEFDGKTVGGGTDYIVRGKLDWSPSAIPGFDALLESEYSSGTSYHDFAFERLPAPLCLGCALGAHQPVGFYDENQNGDFPFRTHTSLNVLHVTDDIGDYAIKSVSSFHYSDFNASQGSDQDFTSIDLFRTQIVFPTHTASEDITVQTKYSIPLNFLAGLSYLKDNRTANTSLGGLAFAPLEMGPFAGTEPSNASTVVTTSVSGFVEGTYKITEALTFIAGGRYNVDRRVLDTSNDALAQVVFGNPGFEQRVQYHAFTPRFVLQYDTPIGDFYVSDTKGFKSGGMNTPAFSEAPLIAPERIRSDEIGLKSKWLDNRLQTNVDVFNYRISDLQVEVEDVLAGGEVVKNAATAKATGAEFTGRFAATSNITLGAGGDYLHARFGDYPDAAVYCPSATGLVSCTADLAGATLPHAPEFTAYGTVEYGFVPVGGYRAAIAVLARWTDNFLFIDGAGGPLGLDKQRSYTVVNLNAWVSPDDERYRVGLYVDNATATKYYDFASTAGPYGAFYQAAPPLTFGVKLQYKFGGH